MRTSTREELEAENTQLRAALAEREDELRIIMTANADVTTRDLAQALEATRSALTHSQARLRAIFDSAGDFAIVVTDKGGIITGWNSGAERTMNWTATEACGQHTEIFFTPEDRAAGRADHEMRCALKDGRALDERWHLRRNGQRFWASGELMPVLDETGIHVGFVKILRDRTEQREAAARQQADAEFMRSVLASSADCIKVVDLDARLTFMNEGGMQVMEISDFNDVKGCFWPGFWTGQANADALVALDVARAGGVGHFQGAASTYLGTPKWWDVQVTAIRGPDGTPDKLLAVSRDISDLKVAQSQLASSEAYWRGLFERLSEGFIVGEVIRDDVGRIIDWRYIDVNPAWGDLVGVDPRASVGRTIREVFPGIEDAWVDEFAEVVRTAVGTTFTRQVGTIERWYEGRAFRLTPERFGVIFLEITERVKAEARRAALLDLEVALRDARSRSEMTRSVCRIVGQALGATRVGFGMLSEDARFIDIEPDWTAPGALSLAGRHRFEDYGRLGDDIEAGRLLVITDVANDPRTRDDPGPLLTLGVVSLVNVPVRERGRTVALFYVHDSGVRTWSSDEQAFFQSVADRVQVALARMRAEQQQHVLKQELSHRLKNTFAMVQAIATQTLKGVTEQDAVNAFKERLIALSKAHDLLLQQSWTAAPILAVIEATLTLHAAAERIVIDGPPLSLGPRAVLSLSLLLHELATNAVKYGALSVSGGRVFLSWSVLGDNEQAEVVLTWSERGGPPAVEPERRGFGARLIRTGLAGTGQSSLRYEPTGLHAEFRAPLNVVTQH